MKAPSHIVIEGRAYRWRDLLHLRRRQIAQARATEGEQPALFPLKEDRRPVTGRTASGRYREPTLFD